MQVVQNLLCASDSERGNNHVAPLLVNSGR